MLHKLDAGRLCPGMYIVDTGISWLKHPYLYSANGELTEQELSSLREEGYTEAYIDLTRCRPGTLPPELEALIPSLSSQEMAEEFMPPPPKVSLEEELPKARKVFRSSLIVAKNLMEAVRKGTSFDPPAVEPLVENILESLEQNADALFSLCKLRQTDDYTYTHCVNVSVMSVMFARGLGMSADALHGIGLGGLFHDVGKAMVPHRILHAPRRLNADEMAIMKRHPQFGFDYLQAYRSAPREVYQIALEHHEQYCSQGYPHSLPPDAISLPGRIAAVVDVFDALSSKRVYKESMPLSKSLSILYSMREKEFFPGMAERFIRLLGVYPIGSAVELEDGSVGIVSEANTSSPMRPKVILVRDKNGRSLERRLCDLAAEGAPAIRKALDAATLRIDPAVILGLTT